MKVFISHSNVFMAHILYSDTPTPKDQWIYNSAENYEESIRAQIGDTLLPQIII